MCVQLIRMKVAISLFSLRWQGGDVIPQVNKGLREMGNLFVLEKALFSTNQSYM